MRDVSSYAVPENVRHLEDIQERLNDELNPSTHLGTIFAEEVATLTWEIEMYRKAKAAVVRLYMVDDLSEANLPLNAGISISPIERASADAQREDIGRFLRGQLNQSQVPSLSGRYVQRSEREIDAMAAAMSQLSEIDALIAKAEYRRHAALTQFEKYEAERGAQSRVQPVAT